MKTSCDVLSTKNSVIRRKMRLNKRCHGFGTPKAKKDSAGGDVGSRSQVDAAAEEEEEEEEDFIRIHRILRQRTGTPKS